MGKRARACVHPCEDAFPPSSALLQKHSAGLSPESASFMQATRKGLGQYILRPKEGICLSCHLLIVVRTSDDRSL
jgi:hypothetical protein